MKKNTLSIIIRCIVAWYAIQICVLLFSEVTPAYPTFIRTKLRCEVHAKTQQIQGKALSHYEIENCLTGSNFRTVLNLYETNIRYSNATNWTVRLIPKVRKDFNYPWYWRILSLNFTTYRYPDFIIEHDTLDEKMEYPQP